MGTVDHFMYRRRFGSPSPGGIRENQRPSTVSDLRLVPGKAPRLRIRLVGALAIVEIMNAEFLFDQDVIQEMSRQLHRLVSRGRNRLLVDLGEIEVMSCDVLGTLAALYQQLHRQNGR